MSSRKTAGRRGTTKKRAQRATSNVFAMFDQDQIQEFKEAFNMIDQNRDGFIEHDDLRDMLASLGKVRKKHCDVLVVYSNKLHPKSGSLLPSLGINICRSFFTSRKAAGHTMV